MSLRSALPALLFILLASCSSTPDAPQPADHPPSPAGTGQAASNRPLLTGSLLGAPAGAEVELALLEVNAHEKPGRLLGDIRLHSQGDELPFRLPFDPELTGQQRVELRGRVIQSGQLIMQLPPRPIMAHANGQSLGRLQLVRTP